jgi:aspartate/methionine/tyrosine aminotransferase
MRSPTLAPRERVLALRRAGQDVISLIGGASGEQDLPDDAKAAIVDALMAGPLGPTDARGSAELRRAISDALRQEKDLELDPEQLIVTVGAKEATMATFLALLDSGDEVLLPDPAWIGYEPWIRRAGAVPVRFSMGRESGYRADWDAVRSLVTPRTRLLVLTNPHNPTGTVQTRQELERLAEALDGSDVLVVSDESNSQIVFDGAPHVSPLQLPALAERTILIRSFSKDFAMPGWRIGFVWAPAPHGAAILAAHEHAVSCVPTVVQVGALGVLRSPDTPAMLARMLSDLTERRDALVDALDRIPGVGCHRPQGAYNAFPDLSGVAGSSEQLAQALLTAGVATVPGSAFGPLGEGHLRLAFTPPSETLLRAVYRISRALAHD